ncbi:MULTISPECIES: histidinol dehydrogenase [unclassified Cryobacterium]|uniref:histidinol dehydrogenase n=1 Tax=unclassified Cryobacterium TaxID=2649013 RepID=UPI00106DB49A|nr:MULTISPECIES: histidinol dehydrogenase [unclassified Cryobacterium]TFD03574.1 histidinol dehydrogenase [Cryobacterium sp. TMT1-66-1]TFD12837.1 histidinol dehydrogenase [Cryobacterium sp. TMT1-2-2]
MIQTIDLRGSEPTPAALLASVPRALTSVAVAADIAAELIADVRARGGAALLDQAERLDRVRPGQVRVPASHIADAVAGLDPDVRTAITETIRRVRLASAAQVPPHVTTTIEAGATVTQRWQPVNRVGLYVPGGKAVYPSSVVMNVVPAQVSGVRSIALASPPQSHFDGRVHPTILAVAGLLGVDEIYAMGGAGAIGALAYGVPDIGLEPVQIVTGPGNVYVAAAKRLIRGQAGIDSEAGPTDILVIADSAADPLLVAADLVSQAEHDELAATVLVTDSIELADAVAARLAVLAASTTHNERVTTALGGRQSAIVLVDNLHVAAGFSNAFAPEHLEIQTSDPDAVLAEIENAGAIFLGPYSPVSLGDYVAGSNHVLPTAGAARFSSGLGAYTFLRPQQVVRYDRAALEAVAGHIRALSDAEALPAHGDAVTARFE